MNIARQRILSWPSPKFTRNQLLIARTTLHVRFSSSCSSTSRQDSEEARKEWMESERTEIQNEAAALTRALYRTCVRSVRVIRHGNEYDEQEFAERERKRLEEPLDKDSRLSMLSMLPPVDREDELRSRAEYYMQYARENFVQESDCLSHPDWDEQHIARYLYHLKRGNDHRKWLLSDMKFSDPYQHALDESQVDRFEKRALDFVRRVKSFEYENLSPELKEYMESTSNVSKQGEGEDEDDDFFDSDDEDDDSGGLPPWYKNPRSL